MEQRWDHWETPLCWFTMGAGPMYIWISPHFSEMWVFLYTIIVRSARALPQILKGFPLLFISYPAAKCFKNYAKRPVCRKLLVSFYLANFRGISRPYLRLLQMQGQRYFVPMMFQTLWTFLCACSPPAKPDDIGPFPAYIRSLIKTN